jgi:hypothetical protein
MGYGCTVRCVIVQSMDHGILIGCLITANKEQIAVIKDKDLLEEKYCLYLFIGNRVN